jgi:glycosyltransferase involved in cell wall biosynthesis
MGVANLATRPRVGLIVKQAGALVRDRMPVLAAAVARMAARTAGARVDEPDIRRRLDAAREVFEEIDLFVAPSQSMAGEFERLGVKPAKLRVLRHGLVEIARVPRRADDGRLRIGFVGTLVWHKGVHVLIDAVRALPPDRYELQIFGSLHTFPDYAADLQQRATGLPVRFMGEFDRSAAHHAYGAVDVIVVPSIWPENAPLVVSEAFMAGVPVVVARTGGLAELIDDGVNGLLYEPRSTADLTNALRAILDDRSKLDALARNIPVVKSMDLHAREWESIYRELLRGSRVGS